MIRSRSLAASELLSRRDGVSKHVDSISEKRPGTGRTSSTIFLPNQKLSRLSKSEPVDGYI